MTTFKLLRTIDEDDKPIVVSFSGGETSGDMLLRVWRKYNGKRRIIVLFANTGEEHEATLEYVNNFWSFYSIPVIWLEAIVDPVYGQGIRHRITNFRRAARSGDLDTPFELLIQKLGIPNKDNHHCTRDLKTRPIEHYLKTIGLSTEDVHMLVGIRRDEPTRLSSSKLFYEPAVNGVTKKDVNERWRKRPFRLNLKGYQGNCRACHKKTLRKLLTIAVESPQDFDFNERMEQEHGNYVNPQRRKKKEAKGELIRLPIRFYREGKSVEDIKEMAKGFTDFYHDENQEYNEELDAPDGDCTDSCEPFK